MNNRQITLYNMILSALFLALALVLPFLTGQIPEIGRMLCPMHFPILVCSFFCSPVYSVIIGLIAPPLRFFLFGMPQLIPTGIAMCFELMTYGLTAGLMYRYLPKKRIYIYVSLITAMILGRIACGIATAVIFGITGSNFAVKAFLSGTILEGIPGMILQIVLIPVIVMTLKYRKK